MKPGFVIVPLFIVATAITLLSFHHPAVTRDAHKTPISSDTAMAMINAYSQAKLAIVNNAGQSIKGFQVDPKDYAAIIAAGLKYKTLMLYLGIQNYAAMAQGSTPLYTIVIGSMNADGTMDPAGYYEFAFPCPPYCNQ